MGFFMRDWCEAKDLQDLQEFPVPSISNRQTTSAWAVCRPAGLGRQSAGRGDRVNVFL